MYTPIVMYILCVKIKYNIINLRKKESKDYQLIIIVFSYEFPIDDNVPVVCDSAELFEIDYTNSECKKETEYIFHELGICIDYHFSRLRSTKYIFFQVLVIVSHPNIRLFFSLFPNPSL